MLLISTHILDPFWELQSFRKWDQGMNIGPEDETSDTTQYHEAILKHVDMEYCLKHRCLPVSKPQSSLRINLVPSATASGFSQSSFDPYDLSSENEEYLTPNNVAEMTPGRSDRAAYLLTAASLHSNSPHEEPKTGGRSIQSSMINTPTKWRVEVHFGYRT